MKSLMSKQSKSTNTARTWLLGCTLAAAALALPTFAQSGLYELGQQQLDSKDYAAAQKSFADMAESDNPKQDAALYWLAYAQFKNQRDQQALSTLKQLQRAHPNSRWTDDARALEVEIQDKRGGKLDVNNDEMKLYALDSLMNAEPEKSIDILERLMASENSDKVKQRALFVLSQINDASAFELIARIAKDNRNTAMQEEAVRVLGISGEDEAIALLADIYQTSGSTRIKAQVLESYMISDRSADLIRVAKTETDPELKVQAIRLIGVMSEPEVLLELYRDKAFADYRSDILDGIAISDGNDVLMDLVNTEQDESLRIDAIEKMGITSQQETGAYLTDIYQRNPSHAIRAAVLHALFIQDNAQALIALSKAETDPTLKRKALESLSMMNSDESRQYFSDILSDEGN